MTKCLFLSTALAAGLLLGSQVQPAGAVTTAPSLDEGITNAAWSCSPRRCLWVPGFVGPIPNFALGWGPPAYPHCYWKRGILGNWKQKCDNFD